MIQQFSTEWEWLEARRPNLNSTDIGPLFGVSERRSRLSLWHEKANLVEEEFVETPFTEWGKWLQVPVGMKLCLDRGWQGFDLTGTYIVNPARRIGSSYDFRVIDPDRGTGLMEVKVAERLARDLGWGPNTVPLDYDFQLQGELHAAISEGIDLQFGCFGILEGRQRGHVMERVYDIDLGKMIDVEVDKFWASVDAGEPPAPDYMMDAQLLEHIRGPLMKDDRIRLTDNRRAEMLVRKVEMLKRRKKPIKARLDMINRIQKARELELMDLMQNYERAIVGNRRITASLQEREDKVVYGSAHRRLSIAKL